MYAIWRIFMQPCTSVGLSASRGENPLPGWWFTQKTDLTRDNAITPQQPHTTIQRAACGGHELNLVFPLPKKPIINQISCTMFGIISLHLISITLLHSIIIFIITVLLAGHKRLCCSSWGSCCQSMLTLSALLTTNSQCNNDSEGISQTCARKRISAILSRLLQMRPERVGCQSVLPIDCFQLNYSRFSSPSVAPLASFSGNVRMTKNFSTSA